MSRIIQDMLLQVKIVDENLLFLDTQKYRIHQGLKSRHSCEMDTQDEMITDFLHMQISCPHAHPKIKNSWTVQIQAARESFAG